MSDTQRSSLGSPVGGDDDRDDPVQQLPIVSSARPRPLGGFGGFGLAEDYVQLSEEAAECFFEVGERAIGKRGRFYVMLSGGETMKGMYEVLAMDAKRMVKARIPHDNGGFSYVSVPFWSRVKLFWTNDPKPITTKRDTTSVLMNGLIKPLNHFGARLEKNKHYFILAGNSKDLSAEADRYEELLRQELAPVGGHPDLVVAGAGSDGQIFGLTPNVKVPEGRWVGLVQTAKGPWLTMTPELMERARSVVLIMGGRKKQIPLINLLMDGGSEADMPVRLVRRVIRRVVLLVDREALTWPTFEVRRKDGVTVLGDFREALDRRGPIGIGIHGFMGAGSMANLVVGLYRRSLRIDREIVDGSFVALHRGRGGLKRLYGYVPVARRWFAPELELLRDFAEGVEAAVEKIVRDEVRQFGGQSRFIYLIGHSSANQIIKYLYAHADSYPRVRDYVRAIVFSNPYSTKLPELYHTGICAIEKLETDASQSVRWLLEKIKGVLTRETFAARDFTFRMMMHGTFDLLTNPLLTSAVRMQKGRWKEFVGSELVLPAMEEVGLPLEFYPAVAEAYKRIPPDAFVREVDALLRIDTTIEKRADESIRAAVERGQLRALVVADRDDLIVSYKRCRDSARAMAAQFVELNMRDHAHRLHSPALRYLGPHMTHMFHPGFIPAVEAFLRGDLEVDDEAPSIWRIRKSGATGRAGSARDLERV